MKLFVDKLGQIDDIAVHSVLSTLALLYTLNGIADNSGDFLKVRKVKITVIMSSAVQMDGFQFTLHVQNQFMPAEMDSLWYNTD